MFQHARYVVAAVAVGAAALTACTDPADTGSGASTVTPAPASASKAPEKDAKPTATAPQAKEVPDFVGMGLQSAQDTAQKHGFYVLKSHDAMGRARMQAFDRNWKVCSQSVKAGKEAPTDTALDFGAVKLEEACPAKDEAVPSAAAGKMPDFSGKSVKAARGALDPGTSITVEDATADDRMVLIGSNWKVCGQTPRAGTALNGQPVTLTAVKYEETCP